MNDAVERRRWTIAFLLGLGVLVNYFDRVNLSVSHDSLVAEFGITDITFGFLLGAYNWTYAACQLPSGVLLDRFGVRRVGAVSTLIWSVASFAAAMTRSINGFFAARFLLGIGEAPTFPANAKAIGYWFPPHERSFATSLFDSAAKLGSAIGVPIIGLLLLRIGWRMSFAATGLISFLYFLLFVSMYRDPHHVSSAEKRAQGGVTLKTVFGWLGYLIRQKKVIGLAVGFGSYNYVFYLLVTWMPVYISRSLKIDLAHAFLYTGVPWLIAAAADLAIGGLLVDALIRRGWNADRVRRTVLIGGTAMGLGILGAGARAYSRAGDLLDQRFDRRLVCRSAGRLVDPVVDRAGRHRGIGGRNTEPLQPDLGDRRAHRDRLPGKWKAVLCRRVPCGGRVPLGRHCGLHLHAGRDSDDSAAGSG